VRADKIAITIKEPSSSHAPDLLPVTLQLLKPEGEILVANLVRGRYLWKRRIASTGNHLSCYSINQISPARTAQQLL